MSWSGVFGSPQGGVSLGKGGLLVLQALAGPVVLPYPRKLLLAAIRTLLTTTYMQKQSGCDLSTEPMPEVLTLLHPLFNQRPNHPESGHLSHMRFYRRC